MTDQQKTVLPDEAMRPYSEWFVIFAGCLHRRACDDPTRSEIPPQRGNAGWCRECHAYKVIGTVTPPSDKTR